MKLLITGSRGFLGRRAAVHFSSLGYQVLTPSHTELDITDQRAVECWFQQNNPQAVLHCAAVSDTGTCQQDPEGTARINVTGSENIARSCGKIGTKLLFCSSDQVYAGASLPGPHRETEILTPGNVYARQKLLAEQLCQAACPDTVSLRLSWMYSCQSLPGEHGHLLTTLSTTLKDPSLPLSWPIHDHRGITDVDQVVQNLPGALKLPAGVYNFGSENDTDTFHTIQSVLTARNMEDALARLVPNRQAFADSPRDIRMDGSLARACGISFESTHEGLLHAVQNLMMI